MKEHSVSEGSEQDLLLLGKALGMVESTPGDILSALIQSVCTMDDDGGSALIETASLRSGATICGVESGNGQVHVGVAAPTKSTTDHTTEGDDDFSSEESPRGWLFRICSTPGGEDSSWGIFAAIQGGGGCGFHDCRFGTSSGRKCRRLVERVRCMGR